MRARVWLASLALLIATSAAAQLADGTPFATATTYTVNSPVLGGERKVTVRLPAEYAAEPERRFPVVYLLDGGPQQDFEHIAGIAQSREMNYSFEPFILVGIESVNRRHELAPPAADPAKYAEKLGAVPGGSPDYRRFLSDELKPLIDGSFRTNGHTAIMGESLAALFVIETLLETPELFDDYIAISPSLWWEEMKYGKQAADYFARWPSGERRLYLTVANEGFWHREGVERLVDALRTHAPPGLTWSFVPVGDSETHGTLLHPMALDALRWLYGTPTREYKPDAMLGGTQLSDTPEEAARSAAECTRENSRKTTPGATSEGRERLYYECLLYDLGPRPREGSGG